MKDEVLEYIKNNLKYYDFSAQDIAMKFCIKKKCRFPLFESVIFRWKITKE